MVSLLLAFTLSAAGQGAPAAADVVLVIERARAGAYTYTGNGRPLDPKRLATGITPLLQAQNPDQTPTFLLIEDAGSLDQLFEMASLLEGHLGLKRVRYFTFSKKTRTMLEVTPKWDRWRLSLDGKLEKAPR
jgi:hypothetical protein